MKVMRDACTFFFQHLLLRFKDVFDFLILLCQSLFAQLTSCRLTQIHGSKHGEERNHR
jgi:hypothetical protein